MKTKWSESLNILFLKKDGVDVNTAEFIYVFTFRLLQCDNHEKYRNKTQYTTFGAS